MPDSDSGVLKTSAEPRVTVVIPIFNAEKFLEETLDSVLAQSYADWEAILVDDGSTDSSREMADEYAEKRPDRIRVINHEGRVNRGMCASRNLAIKNAQGEFVAMLDADDIWLPEKLDEQVAILDGHPEAGMVYVHSRYWTSWDPDASEEDHTPPLGVELDRLYPPKALNLLLYPLAKYSAPSLSNLLIRKELLDQVGGFEEDFHETEFYEDQAFLSKVYLRASVYVSGKTWDWYRLHPGSCSAQVIAAGRYKEVRRYFLEWFKDYLGQSGEGDAAIIRAVDDALFPFRHPWLHRGSAVLSLGARYGARKLGQILDGRPPKRQPHRNHS